MTVSIPEEIYKERILSMAGALKDWEIKDGLEYEKK